VSLVTKLSELTQRISGEFNALRSEVASAIAGKANVSHTHAISEVTNLQTELNGKSPLAGSASITTVGTVTTVTSPTAAGSAGLRKTTISTANPSGGANGDVWLKYS